MHGKVYVIATGNCFADALDWLHAADKERDNPNYGGQPDHWIKLDIGLLDTYNIPFLVAHGTNEESARMIFEGGFDSHKARNA